MDSTGPQYDQVDSWSDASRPMKEWFFEKLRLPKEGSDQRS
jgi:hypothetical protein